MRTLIWRRLSLLFWFPFQRGIFAPGDRSRLIVTFGVHKNISICMPCRFAAVIRLGDSY